MDKITNYTETLSQIKSRIYAAQYQAFKSVNRELIELYWDIGKTIVEKQEEEGWGKSTVERLSKDLQIEFPGIRGFSVQNLWRMRNLGSALFLTDESYSKHLMASQNGTNIHF